MILLHSDTANTPTPAMHQAMAEAEVGDEQMGTDQTVNHLLERVAEMTSKEAALFLPGGAICNLVAVKAHTRCEEGIFAERLAHIDCAESAGSAVAAGVQIKPLLREIPKRS
jgi:threonine aldolase